MNGLKPSFATLRGSFSGFYLFFFASYGRLFVIPSFLQFLKEALLLDFALQKPYGLFDIPVLYLYLQKLSYTSNLL
jgi:hypothetical protein